MNKAFCVAALALALGCGVLASGCASQAPCASAACADDDKINTAVQDALDQHSDLGPPGTIRVQTKNGVVYLHGMVDTDPERLTAEQIATAVDGVKKVVNMVYVKNVGR